MLKRLASDSGLYAVANLLQRGLSFLLIPLFARILPVSDFGAMDLLNQAILVLALLVSMGLPQGLVRGTHLEGDRTPEGLAKLRGALVGLLVPLSLVVACLVWLGAQPAAAWLFAGAGQAEWIRLAALHFLTSSLVQLPLQDFRARGKAKHFAGWSMASFLLTAGSTLVLVVWMGMGLRGILWSWILGSGVVGVLLFPRWFASVQPNFEFARLRPLFAFGLPMLPALLGRKVLEVSDRFLIPHLRTLEELAPYTMAVRVANILDIVLLMPFLYAWQPFFYSQAENPRAPALFARIMSMAAWSLSAMVLWIEWLRLPLLGVLGGGKYLAAAPLVTITVLAVACNGLQYCISPGIHLRKLLPTETSLMLMAALLNIVLNILLIPPLGAFGAAVATLLAYGCYFVLTWRLSQKHFPVPYHWGELVLALVFSLATYGVQKLLPVGWGWLPALLFTLGGPVLALSRHKKALSA